MPSRFKQSFILSSTAAIALLFTGCGESKVTQCNKVIKIANQAATVSSQANQSSSKKDSKSLLELASKLEKIAGDIKAVEIKDEKLLGFQDRFNKLYLDASKGLKDTATAVDKKDLKAANRSIAALRKSSNDEKTLVTDINSYCTGS